ncbi:MAG: precorrin-2 dehydrogenase/sirohydrochlorin ferrochelatase family protein [Acidimicrobiales bacterium]
MTPAPPYPVVLRIEGRACLVVGGGPVAARKVSDLYECGGEVTVVAPDIDPSIVTLAAAAEREGRLLRVVRRPYRNGEASRYRLVITATGLPEVDRRAAADAESAGIWVNSADDADHCTFFLPSVHRQGAVTISVSTGGASPALAAWLRRRIGGLLGPHLGTLAALLEEGRSSVRGAGRPTSAVDWAALLDGELPHLVRDGDIEGARRCIEDAVVRATGGSRLPH